MHHRANKAQINPGLYPSLDERRGSGRRGKIFAAYLSPHHADKAHYLTSGRNETGYLLLTHADVAKHTKAFGPNLIKSSVIGQFATRSVSGIASRPLQAYSSDAIFRDNLRSEIDQGNVQMSSEKIGGILGAIVAAVVLAIAFAYGPVGQMGKPQKQTQKIEAPKQPTTPTPAVRGPVVREVPQ